MRIKPKGSFYDRPSGKREFHRKMFFAFEGEKTEVLYFTKFFDKYPANKVLFFAHTDSNPSKIANHIKDVIDGKESINLQYQGIINIISSYCKDQGFSISEDKIKSIVDKHANRNMKSLDDAFEMEYIDEISKLISKSIKENKLVPSILSNELEVILKEYLSFEKDIDIISIVVDRDPKSFTETQYDNVLQICKDKGIHLFITNPCIEFWLLLHHSDCNGLEQEIKENKNDFVLKKLKGFDPKFTKSKFDAAKYVDNFDKAKKNSLKFSSDLKDLKDNIGTNIPKILDLQK